MWVYDKPVDCGYMAFMNNEFSFELRMETISLLMTFAFVMLRDLQGKNSLLKNLLLKPDRPLRLKLDNNITEDLNTEDHQLVTVMLAPAEDQYVPSAPVTKNQTMYEHETVNVYVKQLEGIVEAAKGNLVSEEGENTQEKGTTKENQFELFISVPSMEEVNPFGFNYHDTKQNTQVWFDLRND